MKISVEVQADYLQRISQVRKPLLALAEVIWNGFDADATEVKVNFDYNALGGLEEIRVTDNGHGITHDEAVPAFKNLGGSWKRQTTKSKSSGRILHGKAGKGRFMVFCLGSNVEWSTRYKNSSGDVFGYRITGERLSLGTFDVADEQVSTIKETGTTVKITGFDKNFPSLHPDHATNDVTLLFALYMRQYPNIGLSYDGQKIDPAAIEAHSAEYKLSDVSLANNKKVDAVLTVIEWKNEVERFLFLCDENGFALEKTSPGIQAPNFHFTSYLKSPFLKELDDQGQLTLNELQQDLTSLIDVARAKLKDHFRNRTAALAASLVEEWKREDVYPYVGSPKDILEDTERKVFDVCALNLNEYLTDFSISNKKSKRMTLQFLKNAIERSPDAVHEILQDVLDLPKEKQEELRELLRKTSLTAIINASKLVADRLDFLRGLEIMVFEKESKEQLLERRQLHQILKNHTWIFGEEFHISVDDESLTEVLDKHLGVLRLKSGSTPVVREDGTEGIVDLMLSRSIPQSRPGEHEHLVIELKRPSKVLDTECCQQIENYALAVAGDERFRGVEAKWNFWLLSNDVNDAARRKSHQKDRREGVLFEDGEQKITVWIKTWAQVIEECRAKLHFYQEKLQYNADRDSGLAFLRRTHQKYLPPSLTEVQADGTSLLAHERR